MGIIEQMVNEHGSKARLQPFKPKEYPEGLGGIRDAAQEKMIQEGKKGLISYDPVVDSRPRRREGDDISNN